MTETQHEIEYHPGRDPGSSQTIIEHAGQDEQRATAGYGWALFKLVLTGAAWWMLCVPVLLGRYIIAALLAFGAWYLLRPRQADTDAEEAVRWGLVAIIAAGAGAVIRAGLLDRAWWPVWWGWGGGLMPLTIGYRTLLLPAWFVWVRLFALVGPSVAWYMSYRYVRWRFTVEVIAPPASSVPVQQARASSVRTPRGAPVTFRDPDDDPEAPPTPQVVQPIRPVPLRTPREPLAVVEAPNGSTIEHSRLVEMLEAQTGGDGREPVGFAWLDWRDRGWTRPQWRTAMDILEQMQLVVPRERGKAAYLLVDADAALDAVWELTRRSPTPP